MNTKLRDVTKAESIPRSVMLSEQIMGLRVASAAVYDRAMLLGKTKEEANKDIEPVRAAMRELIAKSVHGDLAGCVVTVNRLRATAKAHEEDMLFMKQKAVDASHHANEICKAIIADMKAKGITSRHDRDFSAVLTIEDGQERLILR